MKTPSRHAVLDALVGLTLIFVSLKLAEIDPIWAFVGFCLGAVFTVIAASIPILKSHL